MIRNLILVGAGGAAGTILRYLTQRLVGQSFQTAFPWGTFLVNIVGCLAIGIIWGLLAKNQQFAENGRLLLMTGLCGGFTTFSAFTLESITLVKQERFLLFGLYIASSVCIGLAATFAGMRIVR